MHPSHYRARRLLDISSAVVLPCLVLSILLRTSGYSFTLRFSAALHALFVLTWGIARRLRLDFLQRREARKLGAKPIPCVVGKWPGNLDILLRMMKAFDKSYVLDVYLGLFEEYKSTTLNLRIFWIDHIISMDQHHIGFVLAGGFNHFWRGRNQKERMESFLGRGIFNRDDTEWKMHRALARPYFSRERVSDFDIFERHAARTIAIISSLSSTDAPCEAQDLYSRFSLDAASEFLFGQNLNTLSAALPVPGQTCMGPKGSATHDMWGSFTQSFEAMQQIVTARARIGYLWPLFEMSGDKAAPHAAIIRQWLDPIVRETVASKARARKVGSTIPVEEVSFLQRLAESTEDTTLIRDQLLNMLLASRDTTACLLTYITYFMATHPEVAKQMRAEVLELCGAHDAPTYENIRKLKYVRAVINETLRLFPPLPLNVRECRSGACALPPSDPTYPSPSGFGQPLYMPSSTIIMFLPLLTQRNPALWGDDADVFDPERWIQPDRLAKITSNPMMFAPFSAGPRMCLGQNYAYNQVSYFLVRLLQQFDTFTLAPEFQPEASLPPSEWRHRKGRQRFERVWPAAAMTLYVKGGMWVRFGKSS